MTKLLQVGNDIFEYPQQGTGQGHGEDATAWAEAVTNALANFLGPNDILLSTVDLANGIYPSTPGSGIISGLSFNLAEVLHSNIEFLVIRKYLRRVLGVTPSNVDVGTDTITSVGHGLSDGQDVRLIIESGTTLPGGLNNSTTYKVANATDDTFTLTDSLGTGIVITSQGDATFSIQEQTITTIVESGKILGNYNGSDYRISIVSRGDDTLVDIDVDSSGQFNYSATSLPDQSLGQIYFKASTIDQ